MQTQTALARPATLNLAGHLDPDFAAAGKTQVYFAGSSSSMANGIALDPQRRLLVAAKVGTHGGSRFGLARLLEDGSADLAFGNQGSLIGQFALGFEAMGSKVHVLPCGSILLAGLHYENARRTLPALALFDPDGQPVRGFGDKGRLVVRLPGDLSMGLRDDWLPPGVPGAEACDICVQDDGRILLLANHHFELADHVGLLIRLNTDGSLDRDFNGRGFVVVRHLLMNTWLGSLMVQRDGRILAGGAINFPEEGLLARYHADGTLDDSFAVDGFMTFKAQGRSAQISQIVQQTNGDLHCFGSSRDPMHCLSLKLHSNGRPDNHCNGASHNAWKSATAAANGPPPRCSRMAACWPSAPPSAASKPTSSSLAICHKGIWIAALPTALAGFARVWAAVSTRPLPWPCRTTAGSSSAVIHWTATIGRWWRAT